MAQHWNPNDDLLRVRDARPAVRLPDGAAAGLMMVAAGCVGLALLLYKLAGPRDIIAP
jgi:hypothetical protein